MRGFLKRDWALFFPTLRFYIIFLALFLGLNLFSGRGMPYFPAYLMAFGSGGILGLFNHDEMNGWYAYAAAVAGGREAMVNARYVSALCTAFVTAAMTSLASLAGGEGPGLWLAGLYGGFSLLSLSVAMPVSYCFGGLRARLVTLFLIFGLVGGVITMALIAERRGVPIPLGPGDGWGGALLPLLGLGAFALSLRISRHIMLKKEF